MGRPTAFSEAIAEEICQRIAEGESLRKICQDAHIPSKTTVLRWLLSDEFSGFRDHYARAREAQADHYFDECIEIADDDENDFNETDEGKKQWSWENVQRARLRVDVRKWAASKLRPQKYGDFHKHEHSGPKGGPVPVINLTVSSVVDDGSSTESTATPETDPSAQH